MELDNISNIQTTLEEKKLLVKELVSKAKVFASEGELYESIKYFKKAYKVLPSEKIKSRISRLKEVIEEDEENDDDDCGFIELDNGLVIFKKLAERLYPHQIEGVKWLYSLYKSKKKGGILADDMGLGKTIQMISFISAMFDMQLIKNILLVLPLSVIPTWLREFQNWAPGIKVECFHGPASKRMGALRQCMMKRSVCITTYGLVITQSQVLSETIHGREFVWDYIVLDEGHRIKRPSKTTKRLHAIPSRNRIILTGTPIQNRVRDLWALMDWITQGSVLGTQKTFKSNYELPIERARQRDACASEIQLGNHMAESLRELTHPYILRRTKAELMLEDKENIDLSKKVVDNGQDKSAIGQQPLFPKLSTKNDFVVWVYLSKTQEKIYSDFIRLDSVKALLSSHRSPLVYLTVLKKICDHPRLLSTKACIQLGLQSNDGSQIDSEEIEDCAANRIDNISDETLIEESGKLEFLIQLLLRLREEGHRTLVFSMSRKMLNIIQRILMNEKFKIMRLDGLVSKLKERERRVNLFQEDSSYNVFLLTTQVGGVGLTLTGADRVVIYDPSWNPASDAQSVDRIYRIGQEKNVVVYRLITCGSVEEKIYRRQIFKNSFIEQSTCGAKDPYRYFTRQDLKELFVLDDVTKSATQMQLEELHASQRNHNLTLKEHVEYLHTLKMFGLSDHDLMFTKKPDDFDYDQQMLGGDFNGKVQEAQNKLRVESNHFTGIDVAEQRWGVISNENRMKDPTKSNKNEPIYPLEGLSQRMDALKLPEPLYVNGENSSDDNQPSDDNDDINDDNEALDVDINDDNDGRDDDINDDSYARDDYISNDNSGNFIQSDYSGRSSLIDEPDFNQTNSPNRAFVERPSSLSFSQSLSRHNDSFNQSLRKEKTSPSSPFRDLKLSDFNDSSATKNDTSPKLNARRRLPSLNEDDDAILAIDSPVLAQIENFAKNSANRLCSDDELILAVDSPLFNNRPSIQVTDTDARPDFPTEIEDSFNLLVDSDSDADSLDDSWKKAFSANSPFLNDPSIENNQVLTTPDDTPILVSKNRRRQQVIASDSSDEDGDLMKLYMESRKSSSSQHGQLQSDSLLSRDMDLAARSPDARSRLVDDENEAASSSLNDTEDLEVQESLMRSFSDYKVQGSNT